MKFKEYNHLNLVETAKEIQKFWEENKIFEKSISDRPESDKYVFYEGPPSANGKPGIHHVISRTIKDLFCRYQTLKGKRVERKAGWDTHGLPVELGVEKKLGITKEDIGQKITVEQYNEECKKTVLQYTDLWEEMTKKIGYWVDTKSPYITYESKYIESIWWLLKQLFEKDLLYKGYTIQPYSPAAGTGLSSHELNMPGAYRDVTDTSITAQFKAIKSTLPKSLQDFENLYFLAWTTTPWTLPSNTALTVGAKIEYVVVRTFNQYTFEPIEVILAKDLISKVFDKKFIEAEEEALDSYTSSDKKIPFTIKISIIGKDLVGSKYEQLLPWALPNDNPEEAFRVIDGDFVTTEDGTGIVHTAPTFGQDDAAVAKNHGVPPMLIKNRNGELIPLVSLEGKFIDEIPAPFGGQYIKNEYYSENAPDKNIDVQIAILLKEENKAFKVEKYKHSYPHCWRTDKPVLYYPLDSWFIKVSENREKLFDLNKEINWKPVTTGINRFGKWLENANDWNLSRSRFWGTPLPIWSSEDKKEIKCIGSFEELMTEINLSIKNGIMDSNPYEGFNSNDFTDENYLKIDPHKPYIDKIILSSDEGKPLFRDPDLIDVWFDSGAMPYAQWHYPFENKEKIENNTSYPADFICEGIDQTRGWFYTLHAISSLVFDSVAYKNVVSNGLVLDKEGQKMSKRLGNTIDPFELLEKAGPDTIRWYMISNASPWDNLKFDPEGVDEVRRKFFGTLYNTYSFFALYANIDGFIYKEDKILVEKRSELDRWIISELNTLIIQVENNYKDFEPTKVARLIQDFTSEKLSNWYVRLNRKRFWKGEYTEDKIAAYQTLFECLETISIISSPIAPFFMDRLFKDLNSVRKEEVQESVHLTTFPKSDLNLINEALERKIRVSQTVSSMALSLRKKEQIKVRQPLQKAIVSVSNPQTRVFLEDVLEIIKQEVNLKELEIIKPGNESFQLVKEIKPNFKVLGPRWGKDMKKIASKISALESNEINILEEKGSLKAEIDGQEVEIGLEDVIITTKEIEGWMVTSQNGMTVALDIQISDELKSEGVSRELVNRLQNLRKDSGFDVTDKIKLEFSDLEEELKISIEQNKNYICEETLTENINLGAKFNGGFMVSMEGFHFKVKLNKL